MFNRLMILVVMVAVMDGCVTYRDINHEGLSSLTQHYEQFDLKLAWDVAAVGESTKITGAVTSVRYNRMYDLELWVSVLDNNGKTVARSVSSMNELKLNDTVPFSMTLPVAATPGAKLRFTYKYKSSDGGGMSGEQMMQSFDTMIPISKF